MAAHDPAAAQDARLVHAEPSDRQTVYVYDYDCDGLRIMTFRPVDDAEIVLRQSACRLASPEAVAGEYAQASLAAVAAHPGPQRALVIGVGGGVLPMALRRLYEHLHVDAVDSDAAVIRVAQRFFGLRSDHRLGLHAMDARAFVRQARPAGTRYDIVMLDAFDHGDVPPHLATVEFFDELNSALAHGGLLCTNVFSPPGELRDRYLATQAHVFGTLLGIETQGDNTVVLAGRDGLPPAYAIARAMRRRSDALRCVGIDPALHAARLGPPRQWNRTARPLFDSDAASAEAAAA